MNVKTTAPLAVAGVLGLVAAIVASQLVNQKQVVVGKGETLQAAMDLRDVVVAKRDVPPGGTLSADDLVIAHIDAKAAPFNPITDPTKYYGRVAKIQIPRGQLLAETSLAESGVSGGLPGVIPVGFRAMTLEVNEFSGVAGLLEPGNHVDILARVAESDNAAASGNTAQMTRTVVQNVTVIAVGPSLTSKQSQSVDPALAPVVPDAAPAARPLARSITILVTPDDAEKIDLAAATNQARFALRASNDDKTAPVKGATLASIRGTSPVAEHGPAEVEVAADHKDPADTVFGPNAKPAFKPKPNGRSITVIRAGVPSQIDVEEPVKPLGAEPSASAN